jgi:hypothetical protein
LLILSWTNKSINAGMKEIVVNKKQKNRFYQPQTGIIEVVEPTL